MDGTQGSLRRRRTDVVGKTRRCGSVGVLVAALLALSCAGHTAVSYSESWDDPALRNHHWLYHQDDGTGDATRDADWSSAGRVSTGLGSLTLIQNAYAPLFTLDDTWGVGGKHARDSSQDLVLRPGTTVSIDFSLSSEGMMGGSLGAGNSLYFVIGVWMDMDKNGAPEGESFYRREVPIDPILKGGWRTYTLAIGDEAGWSRFYQNGMETPLVELWENPQQYGFAIIARTGDTVNSPRGLLDADNFRVIPEPASAAGLLGALALGWAAAHRLRQRWLG